MNPCPCGFHNDRTRECHCTQPMIQRYISKISGPLMDRIDIHIDVPAVNYKEMRSTSVPEGSAQIRERCHARASHPTTTFSPLAATKSTATPKWVQRKSVPTAG
jgi:magnesium chelatase family protein